MATLAGLGLVAANVARSDSAAPTSRPAPTSEAPIVVGDRAIKRSTLVEFDRIYGGGAANGWIRWAWIDAETARRDIDASPAEIDAEMQRLGGVSPEDDRAVARVRVLLPKLVRALQPNRSDTAFRDSLAVIHARWRRVTRCSGRWTAWEFCGNRTARSADGERCTFAGFVTTTSYTATPVPRATP